MEKFVQFLLIATFVLLLGLVVVPSIQLWNATAPKLSPPEVPLRPKEFTADSSKQYADQVTAYERAITAHCKMIEAGSFEKESYELVIKDTISSIFAKFVTALIGFAFVRASANVVNNMLRIRNGQKVESFRVFGCKRGGA